jgi:tetratricopeptide (TPR) repeat protein/predicted Ser/Thr protein kinase
MRGAYPQVRRTAGYPERRVECLDDNEIAAYAARQLAPSARSRVEEHLSTCDACLRIACAVARTGEHAAAPTVQRIGRYTVERMLGEGGMGAVFVAHDPQLDRAVALKLVRADQRSDRGMHARLAREARAMAKVRHPNVVAVYDAGEVDDGVYIAMELVEGETLRQWLRERRTWRAIVAAFVHAGRGLAAAHAAGIVHRDFKPDNVLVERGGRIAVGDFGVATVPVRDELADTLDGGGPHPVGSPLVTRTGAQIGTPRYMSPEQFRADAVDARTDQFSFAVALYEALYGQPPFEGASITALADAVGRGAVRPPPRARGVPVRIERVLVRALAADRAARFASMDALLAELESAARPRGRRIAIAAASLGATVLAAVAGVVMLRSAPAAPPAVTTPQLATATAPAPAPADRVRTRALTGRFANHTGIAELDDVADLEVDSVLKTSRRLDTFSGADILGIADQVDEKHDASVDALIAKVYAIAQDPPPMIAVTGELARAGDRITVTLIARDGKAKSPRFRESRTVASADAVVTASAELAAALLVALGDPLLPLDKRPMLSSSAAAIHIYSAGELAAFRGDYREAVAHYRRALELDTGFVKARFALGLSLYNADDKAQASVELERAVQGAERLPERQRLKLLGDYYNTVGRFSESILAYQQLLTYWPGDDTTQLAMAATALDGNMWVLGLEVSRTTAREFSHTEVARRNLVLAELGNQRYDEAVRDGAAMLADLPNPSGAGAASTMIAYALLGRREDARATLAKLPVIEPELVPHATADLALYEGRLDDARAALRGKLGPTDQIVLAWLQLRTGDRRGALAAARAAMRDDSLPLAYLAASAAISAGDPTGAAAKARAWSDMIEADRRLYGALLAGDVALAAGRTADAVASYRAGGRIIDSWLVHERLARAHLSAGSAADAERELRWCLDHRGQGAMIALPSLALLPDVALQLARSLAHRHADPADVRAAYRAVIDLAPTAQHDPFTDEARRALGAH